MESASPSCATKLSTYSIAASEFPNKGAASASHAPSALQWSSDTSRNSLQVGASLASSTTEKTGLSSTRLCNSGGRCGTGNPPAVSHDYHSVRVGYLSTYFALFPYRIRVINQPLDKWLKKTCSSCPCMLQDSVLISVNYLRFLPYFSSAAPPNFCSPHSLTHVLLFPASSAHVTSRSGVWTIPNSLFLQGRGGWSTLCLVLNVTSTSLASVPSNHIRLSA
jgi:hypothetical protein